MAEAVKDLKVEFTPPLKRVSQRLRNVTKAMKDMLGPHKRIATVLDAWVLRNFKGEGRLVGGWEAFAAGGRWVKGRGIDSSAKLLQDTGRLRASFIPFATRRDAGIGSRLDYSKPHEKGLGHLPQRRMLPKMAEVRKDIRKVFDGHVKESLKKATR